MGERHLNPDSVRVIREALGWRRSDLARNAGISAGYVTRIETGKRHASPEVMVKLAAGLGVPLGAISYDTSGPVGRSSSEQAPELGEPIPAPVPAAVAS